jgi:hypothetical protein
VKSGAPTGILLYRLQPCPQASVFLLVSVVGVFVAQGVAQQGIAQKAMPTSQQAPTVTKSKGVTVPEKANETTQYILDSIHTWVWSGFYTAAEVDEMIDDILEEDADESLIRAAVRPEFEKKYAAEMTWPNTTDFDRLDGVFDKLDKRGIVCLHNAGYTMSDGRDDASEMIHRWPGKYWGYCFYHGQDVERAVAGTGVMLAFSDLENKDEQMLKVALTIKEELELAGFNIEWNGSLDRRIDIPMFDWKKRSPR